MMVTEATARRKSPSYPSASLREAIRKLTLLYDKEKGHPVDRDTAAKAMGYSGERNGSALQMISSLQHFGLIESSGKGALKLTKLGMMVVRPYSDAERNEAITKALYNPVMYGNIIELYGADPDSLPSDQPIRNRLVRDMGFTESSAAQLVGAFRDSLSFIIESGGTLSVGAMANQGDEEIVVDNKVSGDSCASETGSSEKDVKSDFSLSGNLSANSTVLLAVSGPVGKRELNRLKDWLSGVATKWVEFAIEDLEQEEMPNIEDVV